MDVNPRMGSLVVFKQSDWVHSGEPVVKGVKYTIRTDIMYRWLEEKEAREFIENEMEGCGVCGKQPKILGCDRCA